MTGPNGVNPPLVSVPLSNAQIARELGISGQTIGVWKREGCPTSSVGAALEWARDNRPHFGKRQAASQEEIPRPLPVVLPPDESVYDVVARLRENERAIAGEVASWLNLSAKLAEDRGKTGGKEALELDRKISVIGHRVAVLRKEQRAAVQALLDGESAIIKLEKARGALITLDGAKELVSSAVLPIIIAI